MTDNAFKAPRRDFLRDITLGTGLMLGGRLARACTGAECAALITSDKARPQMPSGVMSGDVTENRAIIWSRADRPSRMLVEYSLDEGLRNPTKIRGPLATCETDYSARVDLTGLPAGERVFYRVRFQNSDDPSAVSEAQTGSLLVPGGAGRDITFAFSGDEAGQGWGINEDWGGYRVYEAMRRFAPDFFIHSGDQIYADSPIASEVKLDDGSIWRNRVTPAKSRVAQTLDDFRGAFAYNLLDENKRRFAAEVPFLVQWDDHEVRNNWYPGQVFGDAETRYQERSLSVLAARAKRAMFEYNPFHIDPLDPERVYRSFQFGPLLEVFMLDERSYRGANSPNMQTQLDKSSAFLGSDQVGWLQRALRRSRATWKIIASDMPISLVVPDLNPDVPPGTYEAWANGDPGQPAGRELELANLLRYIKQNRIQNVVWVTADVHYASATYYSPDRARFTDFIPFWEFVGGPLHAGSFGPNALDLTFGPDVRYVSVPEGMKPNRPPSEGQQFFGVGRIDAATKVLTVSLYDVGGTRLFSVDLPPQES